MGERPCLKKNKVERAMEEGTSLCLWTLPTHVCAHIHIPHTWAHHMHTKCRKLYTRRETGLHIPQKKPQDLESPLYSGCGAAWEGNDRITHALFHCSRSPQQSILLAFIWPHLDFSPPPPHCAPGDHRDRQEPRGADSTSFLLLLSQAL